MRAMLMLLLCAVPVGAKEPNLAMKVWVYDGSDPQIERDAIGRGGQAGADEIARADNAPQLLALLKRIRSRGDRIKVLVLASHGGPGGVTMIGQGRTDPFKAVSDVFAAKAIVTFHACQVGADVIGAKFAMELGESLLRVRGGRVLAPNGIYLDSPLIGFTPDAYTVYVVEPGKPGRFLMLASQYEVASIKIEAFAGFLSKRLAGEKNAMSANKLRQIGRMVVAARAALSAHTPPDPMAMIGLRSALESLGDAERYCKDLEFCL